MIQMNQNNPRLISPELIAQKGDALYKEKLKDLLEPDHKGEYVAMDVESEQYFLGQTTEEALEKARAKFSENIFHLVRVGYSGVYDVRGLRHYGLYGWLFG